jgi:hypothetical protein
VIEITGAMIARSKHIGLSDPCVICGGKFGIEFDYKDTCPHTQDQVAAVIMRIKIMSPKRREALLKGRA